MYKHNLKQLEFENFNLPFDGKLRSDNRWVKLAKFIPLEEFEIAYAKNLSGSGLGLPAMSVRIALGALIIKEKLGTSDEETVEQTRKNPYLKYFLGFGEYYDEEPFHTTMFVHFRKRFGKKAICQIIETVNQKSRSVSKEKKDNDKDGSGGSGTGEKPNQGKLLIDATCTPADITFPTDLKIQNEARETSEKIVDILHRPHRGTKANLKSREPIVKKLESSFLASQKEKRCRKVKCARPYANSWGIWDGI